jgi:hypothetical protein
MKRRKAILTLGAIAGAGILGFTGYKWTSWNGTPDLAYLDSQKDLLASLVDVLIPPTDTPGAREANVHEFIIKMIKDCTEVKEQNKFINGLKDLQNYTQSEYRKSFTACSEADQISILEHVQQRDETFPGLVGKAQNKFLGKSFFTTLKAYCAIGYFTSLPGATQALRYNYIPGSYKPCEPYVHGEKSWATS